MLHRVGGSLVWRPYKLNRASGHVDYVGVSSVIRVDLHDALVDDPWPSWGCIDPAAIFLVDTDSAGADMRHNCKRSNIILIVSIPIVGSSFMRHCDSDYLIYKLGLQSSVVDRLKSVSFPCLA